MLELSDILLSGFAERSTTNGNWITKFTGLLRIHVDMTALSQMKENNLKDII